MDDYSYLVKITIALFAIVNPIGSLPIFISATDGWQKMTAPEPRVPLHWQCLLY